ncbi:unnamed protein product [Echinostoma caproni]|uniref:Protein UL128 n=1 Tax=Echinostoma caproni TaxID=27848 RepID=A0A183AR69_9TREM|nr:unnamed protein product [Echinostoma caproni]
MEEAVVRSYVHEENTIITTLCASIDAVLSYGIRQNMFTFFDDSTLSLCRRIAKFCPPAQHVLDRMDYHRNTMQFLPRHSAMAATPNGTLSRTGKLAQNTSTQFTGRLNGTGDNLGSSSTTPATQRNGRLGRTVSLRSTPVRYYEKYAIMADPCDGMLIADLLRGPCAVDYSRTRTTDYLYTDPPVAELIQRHGISGSLRSRQLPYVPPSSQTNTDREVRSISIHCLSSVHQPEDTVLPDNASPGHSCPTPLHDVSSLTSRTSSMTSVPQSTENGYMSECEPSVTPYSGSGSARVARRKLVLAAKEHVESMHQSVRSTLLYGKNNVHVQTVLFRLSRFFSYFFHLHFV